MRKHNNRLPFAFIERNCIIVIIFMHTAKTTVYAKIKCKKTISVFGAKSRRA